MEEPKWATDLLQEVCLYEGRTNKPRISWCNSTSIWRHGCGGNYDPCDHQIRIVVYQNADDVKQVFLHEVCHWLTRPRTKRIYFYGEKPKRRNWHNKRFYLKLHDLLTRYDCLTEEYRKREAEYKKRSVNYL